MKKISFFLMAMLFSVMSFAKTEEISCAAGTIVNKSITFDFESMTVLHAQGTSTSEVKSYSPWRVYKSHVVTFTPATDVTIESLVITCSESSYAANGTLSNATATLNGTTLTITPTDGTKAFTFAASEKQVRWSGIVVNYSVAGEVIAVEAPEFDVTTANFQEAFTLNITSAEGTTLKYTTDQTNPATSETAIEVATNTAAVQITKSTQVRAIAIKGSDVSEEKKMTYCLVNTPATAYTVAEAMAVIDAGLGLTNELYVKGEISTIEKYDANYGSITYWIKDEEGNKFECYSGLGLNKAKFTKKEDLVVGSKVVVCGIMKKYNTIYEFNYNNYIVSLTLPSYTVTATAENGSVEGLAADGKYEHGAEVTLTANPESGYKFVNWTSGETVVSTENPYKFTVTADVALVANFIKKTISYELNGGAFPEVKVPTNEELALVFKQEYAEYFAIEGLTDTDMKREVGNFIYVTNGKGGDAIKFITENANWKWLHDYILTVAGNIPEGTNVGYYWRANLDGFFHCKNAVAVGGVASADYTVAGKPEAWGAAYQAAHAVVLPTEPVAAPYTLPTPVKEGYKFVGWYDNAEGTGEPMTVIPAGWDGTLYAIWVEIYTITVEAENGTVEGAGKYEHGAEATLTATAAEGYEFTCWTSGEDTVSTANPYKFTVTADVALVANFKEVVAEPTEVTVVVENMTKTIQSKGWMKQLTLDGEHETYGQVTLMASGCDGTYGTYAVIAWLGEDIELEGEGEWKNEGELDVLEVVVEDANGTVWNIIGKTDYVAPVEPVSMYADVEFTVDEEGILRVTGTTNDEVAVQLYVNGWNEVGYGTYNEGEVWGFIGDTEVANQQYTATIEQEGNGAYLYVILNDGEGNLYDLTAGGMALENPAAGAGSRTTVIVEEAEATVGIMFPEDLEIYGVSNDGREVLVTLWNGTVKKYGEYAEDFAVEVDEKQYDLVENTVATYSLEDGLAVFRAAVAAGKDTLDLVVSGAPWVDPATAEPTDTVTLAFTKGTINVSFDGTATIKGGNQDLGVQIFTMGGDIYEGITSEQFNSYSSYLMIDWMQVKIYRGELKVVDLTNDVKVAYIGVLGADYKWYNITLTTADEIPTALDNINATVAPAKRINNGQLIIINNGVEYNVLGAKL